MKKKLFLIRRNLEFFIGPMTAEEMKAAYKHMTFGLQDEVAGSCGPWVVLSDLEGLNKNYPDLARMVQRDLLAGWGMSEHVVVVKEKDEEKPEVPVVNVKEMPKKKGKLGLAFGFLSMAIMAAVAAAYLASGARFHGKIKFLEENTDSDLAEASRLLAEGKDERFSLFMEQRLAGISINLQKSKKYYDDWIPYVRTYVFMKDGASDLVSPKFIKGIGPDPSTPSECSLVGWKKRWKSSVKQWPSFVSGKKLYPLSWARMLLWDPYWINRRAQKGWLKPSSYHLGCLLLARRAIVDITTLEDGQTLPAEPLPDEMSDDAAKKAITMRLDWLINILTSGNVPLRDSSNKNGDIDNILNLLTCFENADNPANLSGCKDRTKLKNLDPDWASQIEAFYNWNFVRLILYYSFTRGIIPPQNLSDLSTKSNNLARFESFSQMDYHPEIKYLRFLIRNNGDIKKSQSDIKYEFPGISF